MLMTQGKQAIGPGRYGGAQEVCKNRSCKSLSASVGRVSSPGYLGVLGQMPAKG